MELEFRQLSSVTGINAADSAVPRISITMDAACTAGNKEGTGNNVNVGAFTSAVCAARAHLVPIIIHGFKANWFSSCD